MFSLLWSLLRRVLFRFDAEKTHHFSLAAIKATARFIPAPNRQVQSQNTEVLGLTWSSRVGLAAGFDKNADILRWLPKFGYGFAEIGTVTPRPQPGNDLPRLFRDPGRHAIFNRMGFNNLGSTVVAERIREALPHLPKDFRVGINVGKNKDTPLEKAYEDYALALKPFRNLVDYVVVNVSSPNTAGLRSLQTLDSLKPIVEAAAQELTFWQKRPPLLLKLAPELSLDQLSSIFEFASKWGINGWVMTNTLAGVWKYGSSDLTGGWSGGPLTEISNQVLNESRKLTSLPIISVGGILTVKDAQERLRCGADLIQIYSGWIYRGPFFPMQVANKINP